MKKEFTASIVTISYNDLEKLKQTVESVLAYKEKYNIEYIIVDGGSTDGTLEYLKSLGNKVDKYISEKDNGIGDAWNKGINLASAPIINLLNSGDRHLPQLVEKSIAALSKTEGITYANTINEIDGNLKSINNGNAFSKSIYFGVGFYHPTCFFTKSIFSRIGPFDTNITIAVDTDWLIRAKVKDIPFIKVEGITLMDASGISSLNGKAALWQYLDVLDRNGFNKFKIAIAKLRHYFYVNPLNRLYRYKKSVIVLLLLYIFFF